jgi:hypothetical protein
VTFSEAKNEQYKITIGIKYSHTAAIIDKGEIHINHTNITGRFMRIIFTGIANRPVSVNEVEVFDRTN